MKPHAGFQTEDLFRVERQNQPVDGLLAVDALRLGENDARGIAVVAAAQFNLYLQEFLCAFRGHDVSLSWVFRSPPACAHEAGVKVAWSQADDGR